MSSAQLTDVELVPSGAVTAPEALEPRATSLVRAWPWLLAALDAMLVLAGSLVSAFGAARAGSESPPPAAVGLFALAVVALGAADGLYRDRLQPKFLDDAARCIRAVTLAALVAVAGDLLLTGTASGAAVVREWAFVCVYLVAGRAALHQAATNARRAGLFVRPTLIVGRGVVGAAIARRLLERPDLGLKPVGFLDKEPRTDGDVPGDVPVVGASWDLDRVVDELGIRQVVVAFSTAPDEVLLRLIRRVEERGIPVAFVPRFYERVPQHVAVEHLGGLSLLVPRPCRTTSWRFVLKYAVDRIVAAALLLLALPALVAAAIAVRLTMGTPVFFRQTRVGRDGKTFRMLKFRSMRDPEPGSTPFVLPLGLGPGGVEGADRTTTVGRILRATNIDELPQLINVLRGEMSLIGPRPERPEFVARFEESVYRYGERHRVKAGITGWAQVNGLRGRTSIDDRAEWDNFYIENFSLWLDLKILLLTVAAVAGGVLPRRLQRTP